MMPTNRIHLRNGDVVGLDRAWTQEELSRLDAIKAKVRQALDTLKPPTTKQMNKIPTHDHGAWNDQAPTAPGFYWVRLNCTKAARIAEVMPCDQLDKRPPGALKLSFTQAKEALHLDGYEYAGPIPPPLG